MLRIEILPARFGDCILIEFGDNADHRILIDAGLKATFEETLQPRLRKIGDKEIPIDLLVVTHIDRDHIRGILPLLDQDPALVVPRDIWFNGRDHLDDRLGPDDGEALGEVLARKKLPWNEAFGKEAVVVPDDGDLPTREVGGAKLTLLAPYQHNLTALAAAWDDTLGNWDEDPADGTPLTSEPDDVLGKRAPLDAITVDSVRKLAKETSTPDSKEPNGSSIAFLFDYEGSTVLFSGDAHSAELLKSLDRHTPGKCSLTAFKLSHHGSEANLSPDLLEKLDCDTFLVSSSGSSYGHPNPETIARIVTRPGTQKVCFNYATSKYATVWKNAYVQKKLMFETHFPARGPDGFVLEY